MARWKNIKTFQMGTDAFTTLKQINVEETTEELTDSGDNDTTETFIEKGLSRCRFTILIADAIQAQALKAHAKADITFKGEPQTGGTESNVTVQGALVFNRSQQTMHNGVWVTQLTGRAELLSIA